MPKQKRIKTKYPGVYYIEGTGADGKAERIYYIYYRRNGKKVEEKAGRQYQDDMTVARASYLRAKKIHGEIDTNKGNRDSATFDDLWESYRTNKTHVKQIKIQEYNYNNHLRKDFGYKHPEEISPLEIDRYRNGKLKSYSPQSVKHYLSQLQRLVNYGVEKHLCGPLNFKIEYPKFDNEKTEDLTQEQFERLMNVLAEWDNRDAADIMYMALYTGMRKMEMIKLQWKDVDFEKDFILLRDPKGTVNQRIPLNQKSRELLERRREWYGSMPYVFPNEDGKQRCRTAFAKTLRRICKAAALPDDFRPLHGLRHVFASTLASSGKVDMYTLQRLLTHKEPRMTQRYAHLRDDALKKASGVIDEVFTIFGKE